MCTGMGGGGGAEGEEQTLLSSQKAQRGGQTAIKAAS